MVASRGGQGAQIGQEGARGALTGEVSPGATLNLIDRSQKWERKAEDKGVAAVKEEVKAGDKIANLIPYPVLTGEVEVVEDLNESSRKAGGFGSSGR